MRPFFKKASPTSHRGGKRNPKLTERKAKLMAFCASVCYDRGTTSKEDSKMTLGEKPAKLRKEYNYTQEQLADILGVSRQSVSKWESDMAYPETDKLIRLGQLYRCSMDYLLKDEAETPGQAPRQAGFDLRSFYFERKSQKNNSRCAAVAYQHRLWAHRKRHLCPGVVREGGRVAGHFFVGGPLLRLLFMHIRPPNCAFYGKNPRKTVAFCGGL